MTGGRILEAPEYLSTDEVLKRWPRLSKAELRRARKSNPPQIAFYDFPRRAGGPCCTAVQVQEYIDRTYLRVPPCPQSPQPSASRSETTTSISPIPIVAVPSTPAGMTPELAQHAAEALAQQMKAKPRSSSRRSSPQPRKAKPKAPHLKVVASSR